MAHVPKPSNIPLLALDRLPALPESNPPPNTLSRDVDSYEEISNDDEHFHEDEGHDEDSGSIENPEFEGDKDIDPRNAIATITTTITTINHPQYNLHREPSDEFHSPLPSPGELYGSDQSISYPQHTKPAPKILPPPPLIKPDLSPYSDSDEVPLSMDFSHAPHHHLVPEQVAKVEKRPYDSVENQQAAISGNYDHGPGRSLGPAIVPVPLVVPPPSQFPSAAISTGNQPSNYSLPPTIIPQTLQSTSNIESRHLASLDRAPVTIQPEKSSTMDQKGTPARTISPAIASQISTFDSKSGPARPASQPLKSSLYPTASSSLPKNAHPNIEKDESAATYLSGPSLEHQSWTKPYGITTKPLKTPAIEENSSIERSVGSFAELKSKWQQNENARKSTSTSSASISGSEFSMKTQPPHENAYPLVHNKPMQQSSDSHTHMDSNTYAYPQSGDIHGETTPSDAEHVTKQPSGLKRTDDEYHTSTPQPSALRRESREFIDIDSESDRSVPTSSPASFKYEKPSRATSVPSYFQDTTVPNEKVSQPNRRIIDSIQDSSVHQTPILLAKSPEASEEIHQSPPLQISQEVARPELAQPKHIQSHTTFPSQPSRQEHYSFESVDIQTKLDPQQQHQFFKYQPQPQSQLQTQSQPPAQAQMQSRPFTQTQFQYLPQPQPQSQSPGEQNTFYRSNSPSVTYVSPIQRPSSPYVPQTNQKTLTQTAPSSQQQQQQQQQQPEQPYVNTLKPQVTQGIRPYSPIVQYRGGSMKYQNEVPISVKLNTIVDPSLRPQLAKSSLSSTSTKLSQQDLYMDSSSRSYNSWTKTDGTTYPTEGMPSKISESPSNPQNYGSDYDRPAQDRLSTAPSYQSRSNSPMGSMRANSIPTIQTQGQELFETKVRLRDFDTYREKHRELCDRVHSLEARLEDRNNSVKELDSKLKEKDEIISKLQSKINDHSITSKGRPSIVVKEIIHPTLSASPAILPSSIEALHERILFLENALNQAQIGIPCKDQYVLDLEKKCQTLDRQLKATIAQAATDKEEHQRQISLAAQKVSEARGSADNISKELEFKVKEIVFLHKQLQQMKKYVSQAEEMEKNLRVFGDRIKLLEAEKKGWAKLNSKESSIFGSNDDLQLRINTLMARVIDYEAQVEVRDSRIAKLQDHLHKADAHMAEKEIQARQLQAQIQLLESKLKLQSYPVELGNKEEQIHILEKKIALLKEEMAMKESDWNGHLVELKRKAEDSDRKAKLMEAKYDLAQRELEQQIRRRSIDVEAMQIQMNSLLSDLAMRNTQLMHLQIQGGERKSRDTDSQQTLIPSLLEHLEKLELERMTQAITIERIQTELIGLIAVNPSDVDEEIDDLMAATQDVAKEINARVRNKLIELHRARARSAYLSKELIRFKATTNQLEHQIAAIHSNHVSS
eukprot:TRINITY_DN2909_c0_g4_i3.p1 TRINITY_DN2909_c0_g4~~TRINITY_DN2909_c0_g4_i3.p1  ORF type:complete len:1417 (+),score=296.02 TRINITY_DN2909_c0_g4_i3:25-4251(+)